MRVRKGPFCWILVGFVLVGLVDSGYLTLEHFRPSTDVVCLTNFWSDCGRVLKSSYSEIWGIPLALFGFIHYSFLLSSLLFGVGWVVVLLSAWGALVSVYLVYLQVGIIGKICIYCMVSAITSFLIFGMTQMNFGNERKRAVVKFTHWIYKRFRPVLFLISSDTIHERMVGLGEWLGRNGFLKKVLGWLYDFEDESLEMELMGIKFKNPVGLAAGFDYEGKLTQILPVMGFGYQTVGTVTNMAYEGNPRPRLGRLVRSRSLLVNKGFKSSGVHKLAAKLGRIDFDGIVGVSVGRTNSAKLVTQKQSVEDIVAAFKTLEKSKIKHSYYELNISCPNLIHAGKVTFYEPKELNKLLVAVDKLKLSRPVLIKMPITESEKATLAMLKVVVRHKMAGVVIGNLWKDRGSKDFNKAEVEGVGIGNFSGKPTFRRSNELIDLAYKHFGKKLTIVGCGGVFTGADAYEKIKRGASLIQMVTGLVYEGPQQVAKINMELLELVRKDGYKSVSEAVGRGVL